MVEAEASVLPTRSSTTWTLMCLEERVTTKRGRSFVPLIFLRPRTWRRRRDATRAEVCLRFLSEIAMVPYQPFRPCGDRKSVGSCKSGSVGVERGGRGTFNIHNSY